MQDCKHFLTLVKLFFCIILKTESDEEERNAHYICWPRIIATFISQALKFQCGRTLGEKLTFGSDPMTQLFPLPLFYLYLPQISFHVFSPLLLYKIKPHTGGFCHELPHWGHCHLHERAASTFLCWNTTQENEWKQNSIIVFQGDHLTKYMKMYECLNYTLHTNTSISIQSWWHLSPVPPKADVHCLVF